MINRVIPGIFECTCDRCGQTDEFKAASKDHARRRFVDHGWREGDPKRNEDLICPDCVALDELCRGQQWTPEQQAIMQAQNGPHMTLNRIKERGDG